jgi:hypothetical protein
VIQWLDEFYGDPELRSTLMESFLPAFSSYVSEAVGGPVASTFITALAESYVDRHLGSSRAQLQEVLKGDESLGALSARFDEWEEKRPGKVARNELVRSANAAQVQQMRERGVTRKVWVSSGGSCPYCTGLDGRVVGIEETFFGEGDEYEPEGAESPMTFSSSIGHPPVHQGCDCSIELAEYIGTRADAFGEIGTTRLNLEEAAKDAVIEQVREMEALLPRNTLNSGYTFTKTAMFKPIAHVAEADGGIAGAIGMEVSELGFLHIEYLGSTGIAPGTGSSLVRQAFRDAFERGIGISLNPTSAATPFWEKMGMVDNPWGITGEDAEGLWGMTADRVKAVAEALR